MGERQIRISGRLLTSEEENLDRLFVRLGFTVSVDHNGDFAVERPDIVTKQEFVEAIVGDSAGETVHYGGVAWGALTRMSRYRNLSRSGMHDGFSLFHDFPAEFMSSSWSTNYMLQPNKLIANTLPTTAKWLERNEGNDYGLTPRLTGAVTLAAEKLQDLS